MTMSLEVLQVGYLRDEAQHCIAHAATVLRSTVLALNAVLPSQVPQQTRSLCLRGWRCSLSSILVNLLQFICDNGFLMDTLQQATN